MHIITEEDVNQFLSMKDAISAMEEAFEDYAHGQSSYSGRSRLKLSKGALVVMPAYFHKYNITGLKTYVGSQKKYRHVIIFNATTGEPLAMIESSRMGQIKTGALPAMVTKKLLSGKNQSLCLIGSGLQARGQLEGMISAFNLDKVNVYSRTLTRAENFAREMSNKFGIDMRVHETAASALKDCTIVSSATNSEEPIFFRKDLGDNYHINLIGANIPTRREAARDVLDQSQLVVVEDMEQALMESSEIKDIEDKTKCIELRDLFKSDRQTNEARTVFKSMGVGLEDVAVSGALLKNMKIL